MPELTFNFQISHISIFVHNKETETFFFEKIITSALFAIKMYLFQLKNASQKSGGYTACLFRTKISKKSILPSELNHCHRRFLQFLSLVLELFWCLLRDFQPLPQQVRVLSRKQIKHSWTYVIPSIIEEQNSIKRASVIQNGLFEKLL